MDIIDGLKIALYGFTTVFLMLTLLMCIITILNKVVAKFAVTDDARNHSVKEEDEFIKPEIEEEPMDGEKEFVGEIQLIDVDEKTAACIMAIISEETKIPLENLIFKSIRLVKEEN